LSAKIDTTPDYPEQPLALVESVERDLPAVLQAMPNETGSGASEPGHGHRVVLAERLVETMAGQKGHAKAVAAWAVHRLVERGLLRCEVARESCHTVVGHRKVPDRVMFGLTYYREEPVYGTTKVPLAKTEAGPVPYRHLLVYSTPELWARGREDAERTLPGRIGIFRGDVKAGEGAMSDIILFQDNYGDLRQCERAKAEHYGPFLLADAQVDLYRLPNRDWLLSPSGATGSNPYGKNRLISNAEAIKMLLANNINLPSDIVSLAATQAVSCGPGTPTGTTPPPESSHPLWQKAYPLNLPTTEKDSLTRVTPIAAGGDAGAHQSVVEDLPPYTTEEQPWFTPLPIPRELRSEELTALANDIDLVIITATDIELEAVLRLLQPYPRRKAILKGFAGQETYYLGQFGSCLAAVTRCRMGSLDSGSATLATQHAKRVWRPRAVVMVGVALGKDPAKQKIADVLVASQIISYEPQRVGQTQAVHRGPITPANPTLLNRFEVVPHWAFGRPDGSRCGRHVGPVVSGEKLIDDPAFKASLFDAYPQAIGGEMEGVGLAAAAVRENLPWILVKAICDWADGTKHGKHQPLAAAAAVSLVHHVLSQPDVLHGLVKPRTS
jgi:nucleoside phosphorylase